MARGQVLRGWGMVAMVTVLGYIEGEMRRNINAPAAKKIRSLLAIDWMDVVVPGK